MSILASLNVLASETFESHHWWWPETKEIIWGTLAFLIVLFALVKFGGPAIRKMMNDRTAKIQAELDASAANVAAADAEAAQIKANLRDLGADKARILEEASLSAQRMRVEGMARNDAEIAELEVRATADIESSRSRVQGEVSAQVATLSAGAAERIVRDQLDDATLRDLVEQYISTVGASS